MDSASVLEVIPTVRVTELSVAVKLQKVIASSVSPFQDLLFRNILQYPSSNRYFI